MEKPVIVTCRTNRVADLPDHQRRRGESVEVVYDLTVGSRYIALGMGIFETTLHVLVRDDAGDPFFYPAATFAPLTHAIPHDWHFALLDPIAYSVPELWTQCVALWGYEALVYDREHVSSLGERDEKALLLFFKELVARENELDAS